MAFTKYTPQAVQAEDMQAVWTAQAEFGTAIKPSECISTVGGNRPVRAYTQALDQPGDEGDHPGTYWVTYKT